MSRSNSKRVIAATLVIAVGLSFVLLLPRQPSYKGKRLSAWIREWKVGDRESGGVSFWTPQMVARNQIRRDQVEEALRNIGSAGIPIVLQIRSQSDSALLYRYNRFCSKLPLILRKCLPDWRGRVLNDRETGKLLQLIGPASIPTLQKTFCDPDLRFRRCAAFAFVFLSDEGYRIDAALPQLMIGLSDLDESIRALSVYLITQIGSTASEVVPVLIKMLDGRSSRPNEERIAEICRIVDALGSIGTNAAAAIPALRLVMEDSEGGPPPAPAEIPNKVTLRAKVTKALNQINPKR